MRSRAWAFLCFLGLLLAVLSMLAGKEQGVLHGFVVAIFADVNQLMHMIEHPISADLRSRPARPFPFPPESR